MMFTADTIAKELKGCWWHPPGAMHLESCGSAQSRIMQQARRNSGVALQAAKVHAGSATVLVAGNVAAVDMSRLTHTLGNTFGCPSKAVTVQSDEIFFTRRGLLRTIKTSVGCVRDGVWMLRLHDLCRATNRGLPLPNGHTLTAQIMQETTARGVCIADLVMRGVVGRRTPAWELLKEIAHDISGAFHSARQGSSAALTDDLYTVFRFLFGDTVLEQSWLRDEVSRLIECMENRFQHEPELGIGAMGRAVVTEMCCVR